MNSSEYTPIMSELVKVVDEVSEGAKRIVEGETLLNRLETLVQSEPEMPEGRKYGIQQHIAWLRESLKTAKAAAEDLEETYDQANKWFLEMGLK